jgi:DNA-binding transcriptional ArsR family regulator
MLPVLRLLADGAEHTAGSVIEALSNEFELIPEEREQLVGSQRISLMASRVHWAMTYLAQAGLTDRPRRGVWRIATEGTRLLSTDPKRIDTTLLERYEGFRSFISRSAGKPDVDEGDVVESGGGGAEAATAVPSAPPSTGDGQARRARLVASGAEDQATSALRGRSRAARGAVELPGSAVERVVGRMRVSAAQRHWC